MARWFGTRFKAVSAGWLLALLAGCLPIPDVRTDAPLAPASYRLRPEGVQTAYLELPGHRVPGTPARYNRAYYLRYAAPRGPTDTVVILVPGIFGGASNFDILARQLVASRPGLEVWALDRRANALEDRRAFQESLHRRDPQPAYDYYLRRAGTPAGFNAIPTGELRFMLRWGLEAHLRDLHAVVRRAEAAAETVILGGHSLGASMASFYAAFDFGAPGAPDPGDAHLDGLLLLDGTLGRTGAFGLVDGLLLGDLELIPNGAGFEAGRGLPYLPVGSNPSFYARAELAGLLAKLEPHAPSPGGFFGFPLTNLAVIGLQGDRDFVASPVFSASMGEPVGARYGGNILAFALGGWGSRSSRTVAGVAPGFERVGWQQGDPAFEVTDMVAYAHSLSLMETNANEWYFPLRLLIDMSALPLDLSEQEGFVPHSEVLVPTLAVGAQQGLVASLDGFSSYSNLRGSALFSSYIVPHYTHLDLITARDNALVPRVGRWLDQLAGLRGR